jgi:hypothetical protein
MAINIARKVEQVATGSIVLQRGFIWGQQAQILGVKCYKWFKVVYYEGIWRLRLSGPD